MKFVTLFMVVAVFQGEKKRTFSITFCHMATLNLENLKSCNWNSM